MPIDANTDGLITILRAVPKELRKEVRRGLHKAGRIVRDDARRRASWSSRIPRSLGVRTAFSGKRTGVRVVADAKKAPHARPFEGIGGNSSFRHPVFGNREKWVEQRTRPFLAPAMEANKGKARDEIRAAVDAALRRAGF